MFTPPVVPLRFPDDLDWCIPRRLVRYPGQPGDELPVEEFLKHLVERPDWYAILSAEGTGKTSLLNEIVYKVRQGGTNLVVADRIDLGIYRTVDDEEQLLVELESRLRSVLEAQGYQLPASSEMEYPLSRFVPWLLDVVRALDRHRAARLVLLFDDFQKLRPRVAEALAAQLKDLHNQGQRWITCIIAGDDDLETVRQDYSPLRGVVETYILADFDQRGIGGLLRRIADRGGPRLTREGRDAFWEVTQGYPVLCSSLLLRLPAMSEAIGRAEVKDAVDRLLRERSLGWLETALEHLREQATGTLPRKAALSVLQQLMRGEEVRWGQPGVEALVLKGIVRRTDEATVTWRNPVARQFFEEHGSDIEQLQEYKLPPGRRLKARGTIHVSLVFNFRHFVMLESKEAFDSLRASAQYESALEVLAEKVTEKAREAPDAFPFRLDQREELLRNTATDLNIFRHETAKAAFAPIYVLQNADQEETCERSSTLQNRLPPQILPAEEEKFVSALKQEWKNWHRKSVQLTRDGLIHIRLEQDFEEEPLLSVLNRALGLEHDPAQESMRSEIDEKPRDRMLEEADQMPHRMMVGRYRQQLDRSLQWEIAMALVEMFISHCFHQDGDKGHYRFLTKQLPEILFVAGGERSSDDEPIYPFHDRYVTYVFTKLCDCEEIGGTEVGQRYNHHTIKWKDLRNDSHGYGREIACLLEGAAIEGQDASGSIFPEMKEREIEECLSKDLSSWETELCLISQDNGVVYFLLLEPQDALPAGEETNGSQQNNRCRECKCLLSPEIQQIQFSHRPNVSYDDYWRCIIRGMEYILNLRLLARLVATIATVDLTAIAALSGGELLRPNSAKHVQTLRQHMATYTRSLARLRDATTPLFIARADYATHKFDPFVKISGIRETISNAEEDIKAINTFLQHYDNMIAQRRAEHLSRVFSIVAVILSFVAIPSFVIDFEQSSWGAYVYAHLGQRAVLVIQILGVLTFLSFAAWAASEARKIGHRYH